MKQGSRLPTKPPVSGDMHANVLKLVHSQSAAIDCVGRDTRYREFQSLNDDARSTGVDLPGSSKV